LRLSFAISLFFSLFLLHFLLLPLVLLVLWLILVTTEQEEQEEVHRKEKRVRRGTTEARKTQKEHEIISVFICVHLWMKILWAGTRRQGAGVP